MHFLRQFGLINSFIFFIIMLTSKVYIGGATKSFLVHDPFKVRISCAMSLLFGRTFFLSLSQLTSQGRESAGGIGRFRGKM